MNSRRLNKAIRENICALSDEKLREIVERSPSDYTTYAHQVASEELTRRLNLQTEHPVSAICNPDFEICDKLTNGCYVDVWRGKDYEGEHLRIDGPIRYETLTVRAGNWGNEISSLRVGPEAFVEVFEDENFKGKMICFGPGDEVSNLAAYKLDDDVESIRVISSIRLLESSRHEPDERQISLENSFRHVLTAEEKRQERKRQKRSRATKL